MKKSKYKIHIAFRKSSIRVGSRGRGQTSGDNVFGGSTSDTCLLDSRSVQLPFGFCSLFSVQQWVLGGGSSSRGSWRYRWSPWRKVRRVLGRNKGEMSEFLGRRWPEGRRCGRKLGRNSFVFLFFCFCLVIYSLFPYSKEGLWGRLCELVFCLYLTAPNHNIMKRHMHFIKLELN